MKTALTYIILFFAITSLHAQVGINTKNPKGALHVDAAKNNPASGTVAPATTADDVIVTPTGNVGIGTIIPNAKLEIDSRNETATKSLRFKQIPDNDVPPIYDGKLGVDVNGNVVVINNETCFRSFALANGTDPAVTVPITSGNNFIVTKHLTNVAIQGSQPNITFDGAADGTYTLQPGNTYKLESVIYQYGTESGGNGFFFQFRWTDVTGLTPAQISALAGTDAVRDIGNLARTTKTTASGGATNGDQGRTVGIITPTAPMKVLLRVIGATGASNFKPYYSYISIMQINPCITSNP